MPRLQTFSPLVFALCASIAVFATSSCENLNCDAQEQELFFETNIRPIFREFCFDCHGATEELEGSLDLRQVRLLKSGGDSGAAIVAGAAAKSLLVERIESGDMPPSEHRVPEEKIDTIKKWIERGAKTARAEPKKIERGLGVTPEERNYWAFRPIRRPDLPTVKSTGRIRTPIDAFLLADLESKGLSFAADADRETLIRRAYLDLLGLPPTPEQVKSFVNDKRENAWSILVDRLLESKHYGERWARHWLDVAGYADSEGYTNSDVARPWAYKYRDWVIRALNADMPLDQFIVWQLAGDELVDPPYKNLSSRDIDKITATGFLRMAIDGTGSENNDESRNAVVADTIKIVSSSFLGLSVGCAQCHDHRYDPISHQDYYRIRAVFEPALNYKKWRNPNQRRLSLYTDADIAAAAEIEKQAAQKTKERSEKQKQFMEAALQGELAKLPEDKRKALEQAYKTPGNKRTPEQKMLLAKNPNVGNLSPGVLYQYNKGNADELKAMDKAIADIRAKKPTHEYVRALTEPANQSPETKLFHRGDYRQPKYTVQPGGLTIAAPENSRFEIQPNDKSTPSTGRRIAYARWLTSGRHPLVARVLVNRFWLHHFGKTFVATPDEFGKLGADPKHLELMDWLADELMAKGWSLKHFHRLVLNSTVYQQSSDRDERSNQIDASNDSYWHFPVKRLEAETIRDSVLAVTGQMDSTFFGKAINVAKDEVGQIVIKGDRQRRSIYLQVRRTEPVSLLKSFDAPVMQVNCAVRETSTVATQSLMLMNSEFILKYSKHFANRLAVEAKQKVPSKKLKRFEAAFLKEHRTSTPWRYGYGAIHFGPENESARDHRDIKSIDFAPYPYFGGNTWKGAEKIPNDVLGYSYLTANSGHPAAANQKPIRRWISPISGEIRIKGTVAHHSPNGDGVELFIVKQTKKHSKRLQCLNRKPW